MSKQRIAMAVAGACLMFMPRLGLSQEPAGHSLWTFGQVERVGSDGVAKLLAKAAAPTQDAAYSGIASSVSKARLSQITTRSS